MDGDSGGSDSDSSSSSSSSESTGGYSSYASQYSSYGAGREAAETSAGYGMGTPVSSYSGSGGKLYDSDGTVYNTDGTQTQDSRITGTPPAAANMSGATFDLASGAPVVDPSIGKGVSTLPSSDKVVQFLETAGRTLLAILGIASGTPSGIIGGGLGITSLVKSGAYGSPAPTTRVATGTGAAAAASFFSGEAPSSRGGSGASSFNSSPVIGYQGALVNQPNSPALATANLGTSKAAASTLKLTPAGVSTTQQADTPWGAILVTVGLLALLS